MILSKVRALRNHPDLAIIIFVTISVLIGLFTFRTYGMSWDEPLFYDYARAIPSAYSIPARLNGTFVLEDAYGPSSDHGRYGPAYLLIARWFVYGLDAIPGVNEPAAWHLVNFLTFQIGVIFLYLLLKRWVNPLAAFGATMLFAAQPVIWGHAFINPKDVPFTVFMIVSIYTGFRLVDSAHESADPHDIPPSTWQRIQKMLLALLVVTVFSTLAFTVFPNAIAQTGRDTLIRAYNDLHSLPGSLFSLLTVNARSAPLDVYLIKLDRLFVLMPIIFGLISAGLALILLALRFAHPQLERAHRWLMLDIPIKPLLFAALTVGLTSSVRVLGPLAGLIVALYFFFRWRQRAIGTLILYGLIAFVVCYITWPFLWGSPINQFMAVLLRSADNPERVRMIFDGIVTYSDEIPVSYLPTMLAWTLTEPTWPLAFLGLFAAAFFMIKKRVDWRSYLPATLWLIIPIAYVFYSHPPLYDGFRHFTFIVPVVSVFAAPGLEAILIFLEKPVFRASVVLLLLLPSLLGFAHLHPYEYAYYNSFAGGTPSVFRNYETEYWLTCYKESFEYIDATANPDTPVLVMRNVRLARLYGNGIRAINYIDQVSPLPSGALAVITTRTNGDQITLPDAPVVYQIGRDCAVFCVIKEIP